MTTKISKVQVQKLDKPIHEHDCGDCCKYLGSVLMRGHAFDLYKHISTKDSVFNTTIARYGIDGEYMSGDDFAINAYNNDDDTHPLGVAHHVWMAEK